MDVGNRLKLLRRKNNVTQYELSKVVGCTQAYVSRIEHGLSVPSIDVLIKVANYFKSTIDYLIGM